MSEADPMYARSGLTATRTTGMEPVAAGDGGDGNVETEGVQKGGEESTGEVGQRSSGDEGLKGVEEAGDASEDGDNVVDAGAGEGTGGVEEGTGKSEGDNEDGVQGEEQSEEEGGAPAEVPPTEKIAEAERVLKLVREDPEAFAQEFGVDTFGPRFAALAKQSAGLRKREQELKTYEGYVKEANALLELARRDPVAFAEEHLGQEGYERWTASILGQGKPESVLVDKLMKRIDDLEKKLADPGQPQTSGEQVVYERQAAQFWSDYKAEVVNDEYQDLRTFVGDDDALQQEVMAVQNAALQTERWLTPREILGTLKEELDERRKRLTPQPARGPAVEGSEKPKPTPEDKEGSATVTSEMRSTVSRLSDDPEWDKLSEREQMRRLAAKYAD